jgi:hypothetical protein
VTQTQTIISTLGNARREELIKNGGSGSFFDSGIIYNSKIVHNSFDQNDEFLSTNPTPPLLL